VKSVDWRKVGEGNGRFEKVQNYDFVGEGEGSFEKTEVILTTGWKVRPACLVVLAVLIVAVCVLVLCWPMDTTTTSFRSVSLGPPGSCEMWGDPHIETFDHAFPSFYMEGEFWIVRSAEVWIQGRYLATPFTHGLAATHSIAIGGPFLSGRTLQVGPMENGQITFDRELILVDFPSVLQVAGVSLTYNGVGQLVDQAQAHLERHIVHMELPRGVRVEVMRWSNHINVRIVMPPQRGGQEGSCGNFNSNPADDTTDAIMERMGGRVMAEQLLFRTQMEARIERQKLTVEDCGPEQRRQAEDLCRKVRPDAVGVLLQSCVFDVCFGGRQYAGEDALA